MFTSRALNSILATLLVTVTACGEGGTGPTEPQQLVVAGDWSGLARLPNGFSTSVTFTQSGSAVAGQMTISGSFVRREVIGAVNTGARTVSWGVAVGCERWVGILNVAADARTMDGTLVIDRAGCVPVRSSGSGTLALTRE